MTSFPKPVPPQMEELEARVLYSADLAPLALQGLAAEHRSVAAAAPAETADAAAAAGARPYELAFVDARVPDADQQVDALAARRGAEVDVVTIDSDEDGGERIAEVLAQQPAGTAWHVIGHADEGATQLGTRSVASLLAAPATELVFIDASVDDAQQLLADIRRQAAEGRRIEAIVLDVGRDGIAQITEALAGRNGVAALHFVTHGDAGRLLVGNSVLDQAALQQRADEIAGWRSALADDADLLVYGCDVAAGVSGQAFVDILAQLTGADVAASDDRTGTAARGGDWTLEMQTGHIEAQLAFGLQVQAQWKGVLATYTVTNTSDSGAGSLRQAITSANSNGGTDTINFNIAGTGVHTITLTSALPSITGAVILDATTDDSFATNGSKPAVVVDMNNITNSTLRLTSTADGSTIRGLLITRYDLAGISIDSGSDGNTIAGNYIGGLDTNGNAVTTTAGSYNIYIQGANNIIGGSTAADRNVISNTGAGNNYTVMINGAAANGNIIRGNYINTDATGTTNISVGTARLGVTVYNGAANTMIGGPGANDGNVITTVGYAAVQIATSGGGTVVQGNRIGVTATGTQLTSAKRGIEVISAPSVSILDNWISSPGAESIYLEASGATIQGNRIGTDLAGTANWGSAYQGIYVYSGSNNLIGGTSAGQGNVVAYSGRDAIYVAAGTGNTLLGNLLHSSAGLGIDLGADGVTPNDTGDGDTGANNLQNFPMLTAAATNGSSQITVDGTLNATASSYFRVEFFANPAGDSSGYGEGQIYLGFVNVATNASGNASFSTALGATVPAGYAIAATATKSNAAYSTFTDTSEFSASRLATDSNAIAVTTAADNNDAGITAGNGAHTLTWLAANKGADGFVSLREAIIAANNTTNGSGPDSITFAIAGTGVHTITLASALPSITGAVVINATTDDSFVGNGSRPAIILDGNNLTADGLQLSTGSSGSTIRGLIIRNFQGDGIQLDAGSSGNTVAGNYIGSLGNSGSAQGTGNRDVGVNVLSANNTIGGTSAADRNILSGNANGVIIEGASATGNQIVGNHIGTDLAGNTAIANTFDGIRLQSGASGNTIGGANANQRNIISGNGDDGIQINGEASDNNIIKGNWIGVGANGTTVLGSGGDGVFVEDGPDNTVIGGPTAGEGNWVAGVARVGIELDGASSGTLVQGNRIGTDLAGTANWGPQQNGILLEDSAAPISGPTNNQILDNIVAFSGQGGVYTVAIQAYNTAGTGNTLSRNLVYGNTGLGIDLGTNGVTANDAGDGDTGANNLQNFPVLTLARTDEASQVTVAGTLNSTANSYFRIEFFASASGNSSGYGPGQVYLGYADVATNALGNGSIAATLNGVAVPAGYLISATATKATSAAYAAFTDTSEFAKNVVAISSTQAVLVIDTAADTVNGDTTSISTLLASKGADGLISLREAITAINNTPAGSLPTLLNFGISGTGVHTITLGSALPTITKPVVIDGTTDDSFAANGNHPAIVINVNGGTNRDGLSLASGSGGSTIRGLVINNATSAAIYVDTGSDGNTIVGNYLGALDANGSLVTVSNSSYVVYVASANNVIGGSTAADRNVISPGSANYGLLLFGAAATGNLVQGNYIGTNAAGTTAITAAANVISLQSGATNNTIGGAAAGQGNVIASGAAQAVFLSSQGSGNVIQGNRVGISTTGTLLGGQTTGISVSAPGGVQILNNWIGAGGSGINLGSDSNVVRGNRIGTDVAGTANWGTQQHGIVVNGSNNLIGGIGAGQGNIVAYSNQAGSSYDGIAVTGGTGNALLGNVVYGTKPGTSGLEIDLGTSGITANDAGDGDTGANNLQNFPVLAGAQTIGGRTVVSGSLNSNASTTYCIEFFSATTADSSGRGPATTYLGAVTVTTDASGNASFSHALATGLIAGNIVTATATVDLGGGSYGSTSELAANVTAQDLAALVVDTAADTLDGDTSSLAALLASKGADGFISLREAITALNNTTAGSPPTRINFAIAGTGVHTITLSSALPAISRPVILDASTDDSFATQGGKPAIVINGNNGNFDGLTLAAGSGGSTVRGFVVTGFLRYGVVVAQGSDDNTIAGNYLGNVGADGLQSSAPSASGALLVAGNGNTIGGSVDADRNVIGSVGHVVAVTGNNNVLLGNYIGVDVTGNTMFTNTQRGIDASGNGTRIEHNVVMSLGAPSIWLGGSGAYVSDNRIGIRADGSGLLGTPSTAIQVGGSGAHTVVDNWIGSTQYYSVELSSNGNTVQRNRIGTDLAGTADWGSQFGGIWVAGSNNRIGGADPGQGNVVAFANKAGNGSNGIRVDSGIANALLGNVVYGLHAGGTPLAIDLGPWGVTSNDTGDADTGANNLQNFPVLTQALRDVSGPLQITGTLNSTANSYFRIEFFASPAANASGYGEGRIYLGFLNVGTDASGNATISTTLDGTNAPVGYVVTATATRSNSGYSSFTDTSEFSAAQTVTELNVAPVLAPAGPTLAAIDEDATANAGQTVAAILGSTVSDANTAAVQGIAVTTVASGNGTWQYSTDGGSSWTAVGAVSNTSALLLRATDLMRFVPNGQNGTSASITYRAWDQTSGSAGSKVTTASNGGTTAFSAATDTASIIVTAVNDAPVLTAAAPSLTAIDEDATGNGGQTIASIVGSSIADVDTGATQGIAVTATANGNGKWQYSIDGGSSWTDAGSVSNTSALLLRSTDLVRFVPNGTSGTTGSITYRAWDQTSGSTGTRVTTTSNGGTTAFSTATDTASITVTAINDAPVLTPAVPSLTTLDEDATGNAGQTVASIVGSSITDVDTGAVQGIAVTATADGNGTWQYSTNGGTSWTNVGAVSTTSALLLRSTDLVRFVPNGQNATIGSITYRAWDQTSGSAGTKVTTASNGGTTAFSAATDTASITVTAVNDAPVLTAIAPALTTISSTNTAHIGETVASIVGPSIIDVDTGAVQGIAITATANGTGKWQYSTDAGSSWTDVGAVSNTSALLLRDTDRMRFVPAGAATTGSLTYRAWDQTSGTAGSKATTASNGGITAFSTATDTASITVTSSVNTAPSFGSGGTVVSDFGTTTDYANASALQSDGKLIVAGGIGTSFGIARYNADGSLDTGFGTGGRAVTGVGDNFGEALAVVVQADGKILAGGYAFVSNKYVFMLVRYNADGSLDTGFGTGGQVQTGFDAGDSRAIGRAVLLQSDGKIVLVGESGTAGSRDFALARYNSDGSLDTGFGTGGKVKSNVATFDTAYAAALDTSGRILVAGGSSASGSNYDFSLLRFNSNGSLDTTFSGSGKVSTAVSAANDYARGIALQSDGKIVLAGDSDNRVALARYNTDGSLDTSFSGDGLQIAVVGSDAQANSVSIQSNGRIVLAGEATMSGRTSFIALRYTTGGTLDGSFGTGGMASVQLSGGIDRGLSVALQSDGKLLLSGLVDGGKDFGIARLTITGALDTTYNVIPGLGGTVAYTENGSAVVLDGDVVLIDVELNAAGNYAGGSLTLARSGGANAQDVFSATGLLGALSAGGGLVYNGVTIGTVTTHSAGTLVLTFNSNATQARVNDALHSIAYANSSEAPPASVQIDWTFSDGNGGAQGAGGALSASGSTVVNITALNDAPVLTPVAPALPAITEDDTANTGRTVAQVVGATISDVDAGALQGIAVSGLVSGNGTWQFSIDAGSTWNAIGAVGDTSALLLRATDRVRFVPDAQNATTGSLTYRAWDQTSGTVGTKVTTAGNGGTTAFSTATDTASITVAAVNDAPVLAPASPSLTTLDEDATGNAGQTVASIVGSSITDVDTGATQGIAITGANAGNGTWQYSTNGGSSWSAVGAVTNTSALLLRDTDLVRFVPNGQNATTGSITYRAWDQTSGSTGSKVTTASNGGITAFSTAVDTATITVTAINDAPVLAPTAPALISLSATDTDSAGQTVGSFVGTSITDPDGAGLPYGIAITGLASGSGTWQYSTNGGSSWTAIGAVGNTSALLLRSNDLVRFVPSGASTTSGTLSYRAWDQTSGSAGSKVTTASNGGATAFSTATDTAGIAVTADPNVAPSLGTAGPGSLVLPGTGLQEGRASVVLADGSILLASIDWTNSADIKAMLTRLRPDGSLDTSFGSGGTAMLTGIDSVNAMVLQADGKILLAGLADSGNAAVARINADGSMDTSFGTGGVAVFSRAGYTAYFYSLALQADGKIVAVGITTTGLSINDNSLLVRFNSNGTLDTGFGTSGHLYVALSAGDIDRFCDVAIQADGKIVVAGLVGSNVAVLRFNADGTADTGFGTSGRVNTSVGGDAAGYTLALQPDGKILVGGTSRQASDEQFLVLRYNSDGSPDATWGVTGTVLTPTSNPDNVILHVGLQADGKVVAAGYTGTSGGTQSIALLRYNADGLLDTGFGGTGIVSTIATGATGSSGDGLTIGPDGKIVVSGYAYVGTDRRSTAVRYNADGSLDPSFGMAALNNNVAFTENGTGVVLAPAITVSDFDLDGSGSYAGAKLTLARNGGASAQDVFSATGLLGALNAGGNVVYDGTVIGTVTQNSGGTLVLTFGANATQGRINGALRLIAYANSSDAPPASVRVDWTFDDGNTGTQGYGGALSASGSTTVAITAVNDAPVLTPAAPALPAITEDDTANTGRTVAQVVGATIGDADAGALQGIAVSGISSGNGTWQFSTDGGSTWSAIGTVSDTSALLLRPTDHVRFVPNGQNATAGSITYRAWDQTSGSAGSKASTASNGGTTAFSASTDTATIAATAVNDAPVLTPAAPSLNTIDEDATGNGGQTVASIVGSSITDVDTGATQGIAVTATADGNGKWQYSVDGGSSWADVGTVSNTSALLLRDTDRLRFVPNGQNATTGSITYRAWDQTSGSAGSKVTTASNGGTTAFSTGTDTASIIVTAINDAPVVTTTAGTTSYTENATAVAIDPGLTVSDVDNAQLNGATVRIGTNYANGQDVLGFTDQNGITGTWNSATGTLTLAGAATLAQYQAALRSVTYVNTSDHPGTALRTVVFSVDDGTANSAEVARDVAVTAVNDAPSGTTRTVTTLEDTTYTFTVSDFGFSDVDGHALQAVKVATTPGAGTLTLSGIAVTAGQTISLADITAGHLKFTPAADAHGTGYASFTFQVQDDGSTANGGVDTDTTPRTMTVDVTAVNDAPQGRDATLVVPAGGHVFTQADFGFSDTADQPGHHLLAVIADQVPSAGSLTLGGQAVAAGAVITAADLDAGRLVYTPLPGQDAVLGFRVRDDGGTAFGGADTDPTTRSLRLLAPAANQAPVVAHAQFAIAQGQAVLLNGTEIAASDPDGAFEDLSFTVSDVRHGRFELAGRPGVEVSVFTARQLMAGGVRFVQDGSALAPSFVVVANDGQLDSSPAIGNITFSAAPAPAPSPEPPVPPPPAPEPAPAPVPTVPQPTWPSIDPARPELGAPETPPGPAPAAPPAADPAAPAPQAGVEGPATEAALQLPPPPPNPRPAGAEGDADNRASIRWNGGVLRDTVALLRSLFDGDLGDGPLAPLDTTPLQPLFVVQFDGTGQARSALTAEGSASAAASSESPASEADGMQLGLQASYVALSTGLLWWATRAGGLLASMLATTPGWRNLDPLPILGEDDDEDADGEPMTGDDPEGLAEQENAADALFETEA